LDILRGREYPRRSFLLLRRENFPRRRLPEKKMIPGGKKSPEKVLPEKRAVPARAVSRKAVPEMGETVARSEVREESGGLNASPDKARKKPALDKGKGKVTEEMLRKEKEISVPKLMSSAIRSYHSAVPPPKPKVKSTMEEICGASDFEPIVMLKAGAPSKVLPPKSDSENRDPVGEKRSRDEEVLVDGPEKRQKVDHARYFDDILGRHLASHSLPDLGEANIVPTGSSPVASVGDGLSDPCGIHEEVPLTLGSEEAGLDHQSYPFEDEVAVQPLGVNQSPEVAPPSPAVASVECPTRETPADDGSSFWGPLLSSLGMALPGILCRLFPTSFPKGHSRGAGRVSSEKFIDLLMHQKITVSFVNCASLCFQQVHCSLLTLVFQDVVNAVGLFLEFRDSIKACPDEVSALRKKLQSSEDDVARLAKLVEDQAMELRGLASTQVLLEARASESEGLRSRLNAAEARVAELESKIKEQPDSEAQAAQRADLQDKLSTAEDRIVDLEAELLIMGVGRQKIVAMHAEVTEELCRVKQESAEVESRASILATERDSLVAALAEARDQSSEDQARAENSLALVQTVQLEYKITRKKLRGLRKRHHHYRALSQRYFQQLCCMARVRDGAWALGYCWGFSTFRHLYLHPSPDVDLERLALEV
jgi:hypothetical protein